MSEILYSNFVLDGTRPFANVPKPHDRITLIELKVTTPIKPFTQRRNNNVDVLLEVSGWYESFLSVFGYHCWPATSRKNFYVGRRALPLMLPLLIKARCWHSTVIISKLPTAITRRVSNHIQRARAKFSSDSYIFNIIAKPWWFMFEARKKWNSWNSLKGMNSSDAMTNYIQLSKEKLRQYY